MGEKFFLIISSILLFLLSIFVELRMRKHFDFFKPTFVFSVIFLLQYIIPVFLLLTNRSYISDYYSKFFIYYPITDESLYFSIIFSWLGYIGFFLGYFFIDLLTFKQKEKYKSELNYYVSYNNNRFKIIVLIFFLISIVLIVLMLEQIGFLNIIANLHRRLNLMEGNYLFILSYILLAIISYLFLYTKKRNTFFSVFFLLLSLLVAVLFGSRQNILAPLAIYVILYNFWIKKLSKKQIFTFFFIVVVIYIGYHMLQELIVMGTILMNPYGSQNFLDSLLSRVTAGNLIGIQQLSLIIEGIKHTNHFFLGETFVELFVFFIPRRLFPLKPISPAGILTKTFLPNLYLLGTTLPPTLIGEFYMNFSIFGIVFGMFLFGLIFRIFYNTVITTRNFKNIYVYSILITFMYAWIRGETFSPTVLALLFIFIGIFAIQFISKKFLIGVKLC